MTEDDVIQHLCSIDYDRQEVRLITGYFETDEAVFDTMAFCFIMDLLHTKYGVAQDRTQIVLDRFIEAMRAMHPEECEI